MRIDWAAIRFVAMLMVIVILTTWRWG